MKGRVAPPPVRYLLAGVPSITVPVDSSRRIMFRIGSIMLVTKTIYLAGSQGWLISKPIMEIMRVMALSHRVFD